MPLTVGLGELVGERLHERVAAGAVAAAHAAQVAVELAALEEVRERLLADPLGAHVGQVLLAADRLEQRRRDDEPAEPQRGRERLARRAGVGDAVGLEALERADRRAVVAVLGVVVVLDRERVAVAQPGEQRGAALAGEHGAGRVLVGGGEDDGVLVARAPARAGRRSSTAIGTGSRPARRAISSCSGLAGSSIAMRRAPPAASAWQSSVERLGVAARDHDARRRRRPRRGRGRGSRRAPARRVSRPSSRRTGGRRRASSASASRVARSQAARGKLETSGTLGRKSKRGGGRRRGRAARARSAAAGASDTRGRAPCRRLR